MGPIAWVKRKAASKALYAIAKRTGIDLKPYKPAAKRAKQEATRRLRGVNMKAGIRSTEFWLTIIGVILGVITDQLGIPLPKEAILAIAAYVLGRSFVKGKAAANGGAQS